jgi:2'-5' RNA ligase
VAEERVRLFAALRLPEDIRDALTSWRSRALRDVPGLRLIPPEHQHVTLCFLGWRAVAEVGAIAAACQVAAERPAPQLRLGGGVWLPPRRPRVLAVELDDPEGALAAMQSSLSDALSAGGFYEPEKRPFFAHVTVARVRGERRFRAPELAAPPSLPVHASQVTLYRSRLASGGARYEPLATLELGSTQARR